MKRKKFIPGKRYYFAIDRKTSGEFVKEDKDTLYFKDPIRHQPDTKFCETDGFITFLRDGLINQTSTEV